MVEPTSSNDPAATSEDAPYAVVPKNVIEDLVEAIRDLRNAVDPIELMRPLSISEAAKALRCRRDQVTKLMDSGSMPCIERTGRRYVLPSDVGKWLRHESECLAPRPHRRVSAARMKMEDVDPALREFFE